MSIKRRDMVAMLPALFAAAAAAPELLSASAADTKSDALSSATYLFDKLPVDSSDGAQFRPILKGKLATGEVIEVHETMLPPGGAPHPAHHHVHSEMWLIREGTVEITIAGKPHRLNGGSLAFVRSNEEHGVTNPSDQPASYFVVAVGPGADE